MMTGIFVSIDRRGRPLRLDLAELADEELEAWAADVASSPDRGARWLLELSRRLRHSAPASPVGAALWEHRAGCGWSVVTQGRPADVEAIARDPLMRDPSACLRVLPVGQTPLA